MNYAAIGALVRHALTVGAGYLAGQGIITTDEVDIAVGAIMGLAGIIWSIWRKYNPGNN